MPVPPKTKAWLPPAVALASMPERSIRSPPADPGALEGDGAAVRPGRRRARPGAESATLSKSKTSVVVAADQDIGPAATAQHVLARCTFELVGPAAADQHVVAGPAR